MRVGVLATSVGDDGGVQRYGARVLESLNREGHSFVLSESIRWRDDTSRIRGVRNFLSTLSGCDLAWVLHPRLALAGVVSAKATGLPVIVSTYGFENWGRYSRASSFALSSANVVTALSVFSASMMGEPGRKAVLLRPTWGIKPPAISNQLEVAERKAVLFVGRLSEIYKGTDVVLDLASRFQADDRWRFVLAGHGHLPSSIRGLAADLPNVRVVSSPSDIELARLYANAAVLVAPSRTHRLGRNRWAGGEGFGIMLLEAAVAGVPVLASDEGACPETVALLGNGAISPPTAEAFEPILRDLLDDTQLRAELGCRGMVSAKSLSPDVFCEGVGRILRFAINGLPNSTRTA